MILLKIDLRTFQGVLIVYRSGTRNKIPISNVIFVLCQFLSDHSLIERQKERLGRLAMALAQHKGQLYQMSRETQILAAPPPSLSTAQRLRDYVERLRDQCDTLAKRLEMTGNGACTALLTNPDCNFLSIN